MAASAQAQAEATKEAQKAGIEAAKADQRKYRGRKPSYSRDTLNKVVDLLALEARTTDIAKATGLTRQAVLRIKADPVGAARRARGTGTDRGGNA